MRTTVLLATLLILTAPAALAAPSAPGEKGLTNACNKSSSTRPCELLGVIGDTTIGAGESRSYSNGTYRADGTIVVAGEARVENSTMRFGPDSGGFVVVAGGTLIITQSSLLEAADGSCFRVLAQPGSTLRMVLSNVAGGCGVEVQTTTATVDENTLSDIPVALRLTDTNITASYNIFQNNTVAVNQTGGEPTLTFNEFHGGEVCVQNWLTHPVVTDNLFRGCHVGIHHHRSHSTLSRNDMEDEYVPPGGGIIVENTMSPLIENNTIRNYGTGIIVINARAWIRNNVIADNVDDGIRVISNSAEMDISHNVITGNGGDGIDLQNVLDVLVYANSVSANGGDGIRTTGGARLILDANSVSLSGAHGIQSATPNVVIEDNYVNGSALTGIRLEAGAAGASVQRNGVHGSGQNGFYVAGNATSLAENVATGSAHSGFVVEDAWEVTLYQDSASANAIDGFGFVDAAGIETAGLLASGNARHGFRMVGATSGTQANPNATDNGVDGYHVNASAMNSLYYARAFSNGHAGVLNAQGNNTLATSGWFEGNVFAGVANLDPSVWTDARYSYWGHPNGPTVSPTFGAGDAVVGNVLYEPFSSSPPSPPVLIVEGDYIG